MNQSNHEDASGGAAKPTDRKNASPHIAALMWNPLSFSIACNELTHTNFSLALELANVMDHEMSVLANHDALTKMIFVTFFRVSRSNPSCISRSHPRV